MSLLLFPIICCCIGAGYFGYISYKSLQPIENAEIEIFLEPVVEVGEDVAFSIKVTNISTESINLNSISIGADFVEGIQLGDSSPIFEMRQHYDILEIPMEMFIFNELILVGESLTIEFNSQAKEVGDFLGQLFICLDDTTNCEQIPLRTVVEEKVTD